MISRCIAPLLQAARFSLLTICVIAPVSISAADDDLTNLRIVSEPPGAHVIINGRDQGVTPLELKYGRWAFHGNKKTLFAKHLAEPVTLDLTLSGYRTEKLEITRGPFTWTSFDGRHSYEYWIISSNDYTVRLRPETRALSNADVLQLLKTGLSEALIIDKIQTSPCEFQTDPNDITALHAAGVSDAVISAMMHAVALPQAGPDTMVRPGPPISR